MRATRLFLIICMGLGGVAWADPLLTSWMTTRSSTYARVYQTTSARTSGTSVTTWGSSNTVQSLPAYADIQEISYSSSWVYVKYTGLSSYIMGPWLTPQGGQFQYWPTNRKGIYKFPRTSTVPSTKTTTPSGVSGLWVNGVAIFNALDGHVWNGTDATTSALTSATNYFWFQNAPVAESFNFDGGNGHQPPSAIYHTHQNPLGLRYQLGDHVSYNTSTKLYSESTNAVTSHSPILGWALDGYPVYGPYGYDKTNDATSGIRRMVSGYVQRDGSNGTDMVSTNLSAIPAWYARVRQSLGATSSTTVSTPRPAVSSSYTLGKFAQDYAYLGDLGKTQGVDFDLDEYNGRYCVTPEYPNGTYAYFVAIDSSGNGTYPYVHGYQFYGSKTGASVSSITETVTSYFKGNTNLVETMSLPSVNTNTGDVALTWTSIEGGTYKVESSSDLSTWVSLSTNCPGASQATQTSITDTNAATLYNTHHYRVTRTGVASYDSF